jgi:uncharacterized protein YndB with AHSA1/START domain
MNAQHTLVLTREFAAPVQQVFEAWTKPEILAKWFGPDGFTVLKAQTDLSVGGKYDITIQSPDNNTIRHYGEYVAISPYTSLIFTWELQDQKCSGSENQDATTLVTLALTENNQGTSLTLTHEKLPDQNAFNGHQFGWESSFDALTIYLGNT